MRSWPSPCAILFYDPEQNLYKTELDLPNFAGRFVLKQNYRNTQKIARSCQRLQSDKSDLQSDKSPRGARPSGGQGQGLYIEALRLVEAHLAELVGCLAPQSVAVLSP